jgi:hypothetical protein
VDTADLLYPGKVSHGSRDTKHPVEAASRQAHRRRRVGEPLASRVVRGRNSIEQLSVRLRVRPDAGSIVPVGLHLTRA